MQVMIENKVPMLRFGDFDGDWEKVRLKDVSRYFNGGSFEGDVKDEGELELITLKSINTDGNLVNSKRYIDKDVPTLVKGTLIMILSEQAPGLLGMTSIIPIDNKYVLNQRVAEIRPNQKVESHFLSMAININQRYFSKKGAGTKVQNITKPNVENYEFWMPSLPEQQKIASFLSAVDEKLQQLNKKKYLLEEYKKGVMQKIFSQELRFKDDNVNNYTDWEEKKLGEVFERITQKNKENNQNVLTISAQQGLISQLEYFTKSVSAKDVSGYYLLENGDFAYNKSYSKGYPLGAIKKLNRYDKGVVSTLYICFRVKELVSSVFFEKFFDYGGINKEINKIAQEGARNHGLLNVSVVEFFRDILIRFPKLEEQEKIANFLSLLDSKIDLVSTQINNTKAFKKGLLQQMFV
jgi:type I restriction enzyme S subunit